MGDLDLEAITLKAERTAIYRATDMHRPFTDEWRSEYERQKAKEYRLMVAPPTAVCSHCGNY